MKTGKEIKINNVNDFNIVFGTLNDKEPKSVYINISSWCELKDNPETNYSRVIKNLNKKIKQEIFKLLLSRGFNEVNIYRYISDLDIRESGVKQGKRSYMNCEITLFLNKELKLKSEKMKIILNSVTDLLINDIFKNNEYFTYHKNKIKL